MRSDYLKGIIPPLITPIDENELIDEKKLRDQVEFVIEGGVHGILAFGSNGEFYSIEEDEQYRGLEIILDQVKGRVPVFFGIGEISTKKCVRLAKKAFEIGATAISVLQPMFLKPTDKELAYHFGTIADSIDGKDMLLYNNPGRVGYSMSADFVVNLIENHSNIIGIKESSGNMTLTAELIRRTEGKDFKVLGGKDTLIYGTLVHGGTGAVAATANYVPELVCGIYNEYKAGNIEEALKLQYRLNPIRLLVDKASFPVATKDYANLLGRDIGLPYKPNFPADDKIQQELKQVLIDGGFLNE